MGKRWSKLRSTRKPESQVPAPSAAPDSQISIGAAGNIGTSGNLNPTVIGSPGVHIHYKVNFPELPKQHQHSPRPDQEPELRAPSYEEAGNKTRDILKSLYTTDSYVQLPKFQNDRKPVDGVYTKVQIETREGVAFANRQKEESANSTEYDKIFGLRNGKLIKRLVFVGEGGVGKSTIFDMIAYDWAMETCEFLKRFKLVFRLKMCALEQVSDLFESIFDQLLGENSGVERKELQEFIQHNSNEVLILLDGFDEMGIKTLKPALFGSVLKALNLNEDTYRECFICVSTRPSHLETLMSDKLVQSPCIHVKIFGFSDDDVREYVRKFFAGDYECGNALIQTIGKSNMLRSFATNPILLVLMCCLWREKQQLPQTTSCLFTEAVDHMFGSKQDVSHKDQLKTVISIGKTALRGLRSENQKLSFKEDKFEPNALDLALKAGILTKQTVVKNHKSHRNIQFMHKTMQEYCAAKYLQSLNMSRFYNLHKKIKYRWLLRQTCSSIKCVVSNEFLFRFCCGVNKKCMTGIVNLLNRKFSKDNSRYQSCIAQAIIRNCFFESQSKRAPKCLTDDLLIPSTIRVNDNNFHNLIHLLEIICKFDNRTTQLKRVETIEISGKSKVNELAFALGYMENLRNLRLDCSSGEVNIEVLKSLKGNLLTDLCINGDKSLGGKAIEWAPHIKPLKSLTKLEINHCNLQMEDIEHITSAVGDMPQLTDLNLADSAVLSAGSAELRANKLSPSRWDLQWRNIEHIASAVNMHKLTDLNLAGTTVLGGSAKMWVKHLCRFPNIQTLNLSSCDLQRTDIEDIALAVCDMPKLTDLILSYNAALGVSTETWFSYLIRIKQKNTLDLRNVSLISEDVSTICVMFQHIPTLTKLVLTGNTALGGSAELWASKLSRLKHINTLDLSCCKLQWKDIEHIAAAVGDMTKLTDLILRKNYTLGKSAELWAKALPKMTHVNRLDLRGCDLTQSDMEHIVAAVPDIPKLTDLMIAGHRACGESKERWEMKLLAKAHRKIRLL